MPQIFESLLLVEHNHIVAPEHEFVPHEPLFLHFDDSTGDPIAVLEDDYSGLRSEGNGHEESDEKADGEKSFEKMHAHQSVFARRTAESTALRLIARRLAAAITVRGCMACAYYRMRPGLSR